MNSRATWQPRFTDYDAVYFADACEPLESAVAAGRVDLCAFVHGAYPGTRLAESVLPGVGSAGFWNAPKLQDWGLEWHRNEGIEFTILDRGSLEFSTRGGDWLLEPGQFTITRPWQEHRVGRPYVTASRLSWVILDVNVRRPHQEWVWPSWVNLAPSDLHRLTALLQNNESPVWQPDGAVAAAFDQLRAIVQRPQSPMLESELRLVITQLLLGVLGAASRASAELPVNVELRSPRRAVRMLLDELDSHLDHPWRLQDMASAAKLGRSQFSRYCRELTNMTPVEYLTSRRIELASRLLRESDATITEIAMEAGFQSSQYFATVFRRHTGRSATEFRQNPVGTPLTSLPTH